MAPRASKKEKQIPPPTSNTSSPAPPDLSTMSPPPKQGRTPSMSTIISEAPSTAASSPVLKPKTAKAKVTKTSAAKKKADGKTKDKEKVEKTVDLVEESYAKEDGFEGPDGMEAAEELTTIISEVESVAPSSPTNPPVLKPKNEKAKIVKADKKGSANAGAKNKVTAEKLLAVAEEVGGKVKSKGVVKDKGEKKDTKEGKKVDKDGKEKVEKVSGEEAERLILKYLREQNRPYGATDLSANLRGKITKTVADKLLKEMEQNGLIRGKATNGDKKGSQWVFWCIQDPSQTATPEELSTLDTSISTLRETTLPSLRTQLKTLTTKLQAIRAEPATCDLRVLVDELSAENARKRGRLEELSGMVASGKIATLAQTTQTEKEWKYWSGKCSARKKGFKDVEGVLLEGMSREELWERVGIEGVE